MVWLDGADSNALQEAQGIQNWYDKSSNGNHFRQLTAANKPAKQTGSLGDQSTIVFDQVNDSLDSILTHNITTAYVYSLVYDQNEWDVITKSVSLTAGTAFSLGMSPAGLLANNEKIAELLVFSSELTDSENQSIFDYLNTKWQIEDNTNTSLLENLAVNNNFIKENVKDGTYYQFKVEAVDDVGNKTISYSNSVQAPDRTAPEIDTNFIAINGTEDIDFIYNPEIGRASCRERV